ncbi:hypothetical protein Slin15195_G054440 [Septoria linicola]|uniref:DUF1772-domain-containing protein n=1 Tax=Septoria linicola TaxID=215465 RepID=A0A9Q9EIK6_9PEZI|nr:hypothetical protein Slin15195_G054440 [Septoria linicola]
MSTILSDPTFLKAFAALNVTSLAAIGGAATGMYIFSIPTILTAQRSDSSTLTMLKQFHHLITLGRKYMQNGAKIQALALCLLTWLFYRHPDPDISRLGKFFLMALVVLVQVAWYEVVFVFPINDKLVEMEGRLEKVCGEEEKGEMDRAMREEVLGLLEDWRKWHFGRIVIPFAAVGVVFAGLLSM